MHNRLFKVAMGMQYLAAHRYIHRDLAARNVLVSSSLCPKITHLPLSADQFADEYYTYRHVVRPLRWMSPEALFDDEWSTKSDVWAWAVFVWELFAVGALPFATHSDEAVIEALKRGAVVTLTPPSAIAMPGGGSGEANWVPPALTDLMLSCRALLSRDRPSFDDIVERTAQLQVDTPA